MLSAYRWRALPAGALGYSGNLETISRNEQRASLTPLETTFERARANQGNRLKQRHDFARRYDEYQAVDHKTKAQVDQEMIVEERGRSWNRNGWQSWRIGGDTIQTSFATMVCHW